MLNDRSYPGSHWSTTNIGEAFPGVLTPLSWSVWGPATERCTRRALHTIGLLCSDEVPRPPTTEQRLLGIFYGRPALRIEFFCMLGDRTPGANSAAISEQMFSFTPEAYVSRPQRLVYPRVGVKLPMAFVRAPRAVAAERPRTEEWWRRSVAAVATVDETSARGQFAEALARYEAVAYLHVAALFSAIQPVYDLVTKLAASAGVDPRRLMQAYGHHEESAMVKDLWDCSRDRLTLDAFLSRHGYHGPWEGELSAVVWREDSTPIERLLDGYRGKSDGADPATGHAAGVAQRQAAEGEFLAALPRWRRASGRIALKLGAHYVPLRSSGKVMFVQSLDVARAAARRLGEHLAAEKRLAEREDVFFLTASELADSRLGDVRELVEARRAERERYAALELPTSWSGMPQPIARIQHDPDADPPTTPVLTGIGASPGIVEGRVRVLLDPAFTEIEDGEILVAPTTDPSWASVIFLAAALVVDMGGMLSHAAVVAREMGVPCVMDTRTGTRALHDGDVCRVDGSTGRIEILQRSANRAPEPK